MSRSSGLREQITLKSIVTTLVMGLALFAGSAAVAGTLGRNLVEAKGRART
jgi:hypothetical protein